MGSDWWRRDLWDTSAANWFNGSAAVSWTQGSSAIFGGTAGVVTVGAPIMVQNCGEDRNVPDATATRPNVNTYWVVPHKFLAGEYPGDEDPVKAREKISRFLEVGVRHFVDLTEFGEYQFTATYHRFPIRDISVPRDAEYLAEILFAIGRRIRQGGAVYMHCRGGVGRTGLVVSCWLQEHGRTAGAALGELSAKWKTVKKSSEQTEYPETREQVDWVKTWPRRRRNVQKLVICDRYRGAIVGLAVGDALGTTLEFKAPGTFKPITDMIGGGPFGLKPGQWTDDTSMALCLAESLIEKRAFDPKDQMDRYCRWWKEGYLSSTATCFEWIQWPAGAR